MLSAYKIALGPILLLQGRAVRRTALRLPEAAGPRSGVVGARAGVEPLRVLFVGDSSAAGVGVDHQHSALASPTSALLARHMRRPVEWQLVARSGVNTREALAMLAAHKLERADLLVTALGVNDVTSQRSPGQFVADYRALIGELRRRSGFRAAVITGVPPLHVSLAMPQPLRWYLGKCAQQLDARLRQWVSSHPTLAHISLQFATVAGDMAQDGFHPGPAQYERWAHLVAGSAAALLGARSIKEHSLETRTWL